MNLFWRIVLFIYFLLYILEWNLVKCNTQHPCSIAGKLFASQWLVIPFQHIPSRTERSQLPGILCCGQEQCEQYNTRRDRTDKKPSQKQLYTTANNNGSFKDGERSMKFQWINVVESVGQSKKWIFMCLLWSFFFLCSFCHCYSFCSFVFQFLYFVFMSSVYSKKKKKPYGCQLTVNRNPLITAIIAATPFATYAAHVY